MSELKSFLKPGDRIVIEAEVIDLGRGESGPVALVSFAEGYACSIRQHDVMHFSRPAEPGRPHPHVKRGWEPPKPHPDLDSSFVPVVWYRRDGSGFEFDFYSREHDRWGIDFLMEHSSNSGGFPDFQWPFETPFVPTRHDWEAIGIYTTDYVKTPEVT